MDHPACIYRVPGQMRNVKPDAYTPRMVLIGPLHRPVKLKPGHKKNEYTKMDEKKVKYLESFTERVGEDIVKEIEETIRKEEANIRASYAEPLEWISPEDLVDLVLKDSIFIMEFSIKLQESRGSSGDPIVDNEIHTANVIGDLIMLENQLPYFIFDKSFGPYLMEFLGYETPGQLFLELFSLHTKIKTNTNFNHFTDMFRCVYEESLDQSPKLMIGPAIEEMESAQNLSRVGVDFKEEADNYSLHMEFNKGCLVMSSFRTDDTSDKVLRNVIAYEQCHANVEKFTSNYIHFLNFLITKDKDVELLKKEGVLTNGGGRPRLTVDMVNKLKIGLIESKTSQYHSIAVNLRAHYTSRRKRCWATLNKVYFKDLWTGTATMAAILLLFFTLVGSAASVIQAYTSFN
ncbi:hypothetical protein EUTSA_v10013719mg [Eutrema salsugineum]|uniref:Uncharacterized protein n=1 Tax=Eutrema salsugineum TaxID=72664 RepID=V4KWC1_EUTSA|nr:hypothetical protein EUTSA_v10013719mg [Eutrema salsugineum]